jgi:hypothetical protein
MRTRLLRQARRWRRHRFRWELGRLRERELQEMLTLAQLFERWPRRWWWVEEVDLSFGRAHDRSFGRAHEVAWVIGG